jgi:tRNA pseudouridine55 synthase
MALSEHDEAGVRGLEPAAQTGVHPGRAGSIQECGILPLYKPAGPASNSVLRTISHWIGVRSLGHSGTLDPAAEGVLVAAVDRATPILPFLPSFKTYCAQIIFGRTTDTWDAQGRTLEENPVPAFTEQTLQPYLKRFRGVLQQTPPSFSALWHDGHRLYDLARQGRAVQKPPRTVTVYALHLVRYAAPCLELTVRCSAGTYIRSLAHELGQDLGCGAHLAHLIRTECGGFGLESAVPLARLETDGPAGTWRRHLVSPAQALAHLPALRVGEEDAVKVYHGIRLPLEVLPATSPEGWVRVLGPDGALLAVATVKGGSLRYERVFHWASS